MAVDAIVVNYNAGESLRHCVASLLASRPRPSVRVVDNASTDNSFAGLQGLYGHSSGVEFIANPSNLGFGPAVNAAARSCTAEWLLVINPDCRLELGALAALVAAGEADARIALAGPTVRTPRGETERASLRRFPTPWNSLMTFSGLANLGRWLPALRGVAVRTDGLDAAVVEAEATSGACMLVRRRAFEAVGGFDEGYALHCEDLDLMFRLRQAGGRVVFVPGAVAVHEQGVSSRSRPLWVHRQKHRGMRRFFTLHQARGVAAPVRWLVHAGIWLKYVVTLPIAWLRR